jgi:hypothetical protein
MRHRGDFIDCNSPAQSGKIDTDTRPPGHDQRETRGQIYAATTTPPISAPARSTVAGAAAPAATGEVAADDQ